MNPSDRALVAPAGIICVSVNLFIFLTINTNQIPPAFLLAPLIAGPLAGILGLAMAISVFGRKSIATPSSHTRAKVFAAIYVSSSVIAAALTYAFT